MNLRVVGSSLLVAMLAACAERAPESSPLDTEFNLHALVTAPTGFYFFPPLTSAPNYSGSFDATRLADLSVTIERSPPSGGWIEVVAFDSTTRPALVMKTQFESYYVQVRLADYFTQRDSSYRFVVRFQGDVLATADMPGVVFDFIDRNPANLLTMRFRLEPGALDRDGDGVRDADDHCPDFADPSNPIPSEEICDGVDNNCSGAIDEHASAEVCDGIDNDCDGAIDDGNPGGGATCTTGQAGVCSTGTLACTGGAVVCVAAMIPGPEWCDMLDNDCDGATDEGCVSEFAACLSIQHSNPGSPSGTYSVDLDGGGPGAPFTVYCDMATDGGGWTLAMRVVNGYHSTTAAVNSTLLPGRATHAKLSDANIRSIARAGMREAMVVSAASTYILRYSDTEWSSYASNGWTNVQYDSKRSTGVWVNNTCNGHYNNRGFSTYSDTHGRTCATFFAGAAGYYTQYHTYLYSGGVGGVFEVYVR